MDDSARQPELFEAQTGFIYRKLDDAGHTEEKKSLLLRTEKAGVAQVLANLSYTCVAQQAFHESPSSPETWTGKKSIIGKDREKKLARITEPYSETSRAGKVAPCTYIVCSEPKRTLLFSAGDADGAAQSID